MLTLVLTVFTIVHGSVVIISGVRPRTHESAFLYTINDRRHHARPTYAAIHTSALSLFPAESRAQANIFPHLNTTKNLKINRTRSQKVNLTTAFRGFDSTNFR